jgi:molybdenum cofactor biosynthesis protein B
MHEVKDVKWCLVVTSDRVYRGELDDKVTPLVKKLLGERGFRLAATEIVPNDKARIQLAVLTHIVHGCDVVLVTGGTGPRSKDVSVDAVSQLADRELPGIGEAFRLASREKIGIRAVLSRASAYIVHGKLVVVSPGNPDAVSVMVKDVLLPVIGHLVYELRR